MITHLNIVGYLLCALASIHIAFPHYFNWKKELATLSLLHRQIYHVHTFFVALILMLMGLLCIYEASDLLFSSLGGYICAGLALFWLLRWLFQFFVYSPALWRGRRFETSMHIVFSFLYGYFTLVFVLAFAQNF